METRSRTTSRLRYLELASQTLGSISPVAAHLAVEHSKLASSIGDQSSIKNTCDSCGTATVRPPDLNQHSVIGQPAMTTKCLCCDSTVVLKDDIRPLENHIALAKPPMHTNINTNDDPAQSYTQSSSTASRPTQQGILKRTKPRKQAGLQALLGKAKSQPASGGGLDLLDFLKKS